MSKIIVKTDKSIIWAIKMDRNQTNEFLSISADQVDELIADLKKARETLLQENARIEKERAAGNYKCGICGKTENLIKTPCCDNWICDDESNYVGFSYEKNSCHRNHRKQTLCFYHYAEGHPGDWTECEKCRNAFDTEDYVCYGTNNYNFRKLPNPPLFEPTRCAHCGCVISRMNDQFIQTGGDYFCKSCSS